MKDKLPVQWNSGISDMRDRVMQALDSWLPESWTRKGNEDAWYSPALWNSPTGPAVDIEDRPDEVVVKAELPGLGKDDFQVELESDRVILRGEKKAEQQRKDGAYVIREAHYGSFHRSIPLPASVDRDKADAAYKHGVLTLRLPKTEEAKGRRIAVKIS